METARRWCSVSLLGVAGESLCSAVLGGRLDPDMAAVDLLARLALEAAKGGSRIRVGDISPRLRELLQIAGLSEALGVEVDREPEGGE